MFSIANKVTSAPLISHTGTVRVVKYRPTQLDSSINNPSSHYAWNNTSILASGGAGDFCTRIWDVNHESFSSKLTPNNSAIHAVSWIDNYSIISGCEKGMVIVNDIRDANNSAWASDLKQLLDSSKNNFNSKMVDNISKNLAIYSMCSSIDSQIVYLGCSDGYICSVDLRTKLLCGIEKLHNDDVRSLFSYSSTPQRHNICTSSYDTTAHILSSVLTSARQLEFKKMYSMTGGHSDKILSTAIFNVEKHSVLSTGADGKAVLWF